MQKPRADYDWCEDGYVANPDVLVADPLVSKVLKPDGTPYVHPKHPLGFDLRPKEKRA